MRIFLPHRSNLTADFFRLDGGNGVISSRIGGLGDRSGLVTPSQRPTKRANLLFWRIFEERGRTFLWPMRGVAGNLPEQRRFINHKDAGDKRVDAEVPFLRGHAMHRFAVSFAFLAFSWISTFQAVACAGTFSNGKGFSIDYPADWTAANNEMMSQIKAKLQSSGGPTVAAGIDGLTAFIFHHGNKAFAENVNVLRIPSTFQITDNSAKELEQVTIEQSKAQGTKLLKLYGVERMKVGGRDAIAIRFDAKRPHTAEPLEQWQVYVPCQKEQYVVTCTALATDYSKYEADFKEIVASMKVREGDQIGFQKTTDSLFGDAKTFAIAGAVGGGVFGFVFALLRRRQNEVV